MSLLRYFEGAKPGKRLKVNKIVSEDEKKNAKKDYEINKRERKFQVQWQDKRPWLSFNKAENNMFCISCRTEKVDSAFANGTNNFKIEAVKQHEASKSHLHYLQKFNTSSQSQPKTSLASQCLLQLKSNEYDSLKMKFINAHAVAKHHKSFKDFELLCRLDRKKGIDTSMNYNNDKSCSMFIKSIANVEKEGIVQKLTSAKFLSVTMDGSTDFTGEDLESVYIRSCTSGRVEDIFLHIGEAESACSGDLFDFLMNVFSTMGLTEAVNSKLVGFTADGASNMQDFGDEEMNTVKKQFGAVLQAENVDTAQLSGEWSLLKAMVYERFGSDMNNVDLLDVHTAFQNNDVDNVLCVFDLLRSLPPTSVKNETCFSSMKLTKNKRRGRLNNSTLDTLMSVQLQSPSIEEFNPDAAIKDWLITPSGRQRKVCYSSKTKVPVTEDQPGTSHTEQPVPQVLGPLEPDEVEPAEDQSEQVVAVKPNSENYVQAATTALKAVRTAKQALIDSLLSGGDDDEDDDDDDDDDDNYTIDNDESDSEIPENLVDNMIFSFSRD